MNLSGIGRFLRNHAPGILMGMGTVGSVTAVIFAVKATPVVKGKIIEAQEKLNEENEKTRWDDNTPTSEFRSLTAWETFKLCWKNYIPAVGMEVFSLMCFWAAHGIDVKRQAVIAGLYSTAEATLAEYQKKVVETLGQKEADGIKASISEDHIRDAQLPALPATSTDIWCVIDGKSFPSTYNKIKQAQNEFDQAMLSDMYKSRAELYWLLDPSGEYLRPNGEDFEVGWNVDKLLYLRVPNPTGPVLEVFYEDKDGQRYPPIPSFAI